MGVRKSDLRYMQNTYGWVSKVKKGYNVFCMFIKWLSLTVSLFLIPVFIGAVVYYSFFSFNSVAVIVSCVALWTVTDCNDKI